MSFTVISRAPSRGTTSRSETPPNSPRGYLNQIRIPRAGADDLTRLICCLLNFLQGNIREPRGYNSNFFTIHTTNGYELFSTLLLPVGVNKQSNSYFGHIHDLT
jgi:hypothetical protein